MSQQSFHQQTATGADINFTIDTFESDEIKVYVDGVLKTAGVHYNINPYNTNSQSTVDWIGTAPSNPSIVRIVRETDVLNAGNTAVEGRATYSAGSSVKAEDLNNNTKQVLRALQEHNDQLIQTYDVQDSAITTAKIKADNITGALIADDQIDSEHIVADSIDTEHYAPNSVDTTALAADAVTGAQIGDSQINSEHYVDGSIDREHLAGDIIDGTKIADDAIASEHISNGAINSSAMIDNNVVTSAEIANLTIVAGNIANSQIIADKIGTGAVTETKIANSAVTQNKLANTSVGTPELINGAVTSDKIAANAVGTARIADSAITSAKIAGNAVGTARIADDAVTQDKLADNSVGGNQLKSNAVSTAKIAGGNVTTGKLADGAVATAKIADDAVTDAKIATGTLDNRYFTETELTNGALDGRYFTETESDARYFNISTGETIKDGDTFPDNDTTIATTAAINDRIIDLVDDVGGFVPIASETNFPTANPDVNNGAGTLVSIKSIGSTRTPSSGTVTIANGSGSNTVTITGCGSTVLTAGFGVIVETTTTLHTYAFHRLVPKATEVTTVAGISSNITTVANNTSNINAVAADASDIGIVAADGTDIGLVAGSISNVNTTAGSIANVNTVAGSISNVNSVGSNISNVNAVHNNASNINSAVSNASNINSAVSNASNINTVAGSISNVNTTAGSISNVNSVASNMANVNNFADRYQIAANNPSTDGGGNALAAGDLYFNTSANELKVYTGSAWQGGVTATGNFAVTTGNTFTGDNVYNDGVKLKVGTGSDLEIFHLNNYAFITNKTNILHLRSPSGIKLQNQAGTEMYLNCVENGATELYHDNSTKFETTSNGAYVTGRLDIGNNSWAYPKSLNVQGSSGAILALRNNDTTSYAQDTNTSIELSLNTGNTGNQSGSCEIRAFKENGTNGNNARGLAFYTGGNGGSPTKRLNITSDGNVQIPADNIPLQIGASQDLQIYHDGNNSFIENSGTGSLNIYGDEVGILNKARSEFKANFITNGAAELYYDNAKKFETLSSGAKVTGHLEATGTLTCGQLNSGTQIVAGNPTLRLRTTNNSLANKGTIEFYYNTSNLAARIRGKSRNGSNGQIYFDVEDSSTMTNIVYIHDDGLDMSHGHLDIPNDTYKLRLGASGDVQLYHDGSNSILQNATGALLLQSNDLKLGNYNLSDVYLRGQADNKVELYYDNSKKFETTSYGAKVTDFLNVGNHTRTPNKALELYQASNAALRIQNSSTGVGSSDGFLLEQSGLNTLLVNYESGNMDFKTANTTRFLIDSNGHVSIPADSKYLQLGASQDLIMYHDGSHSYIANATGTLHIMGKSGENSIQAQPDGKVELYYDNSKKFETSSDGILASGAIRTNAATSTAASANQATFDFNSQNARLLSYHSSGSSISAFTNPNGGSLTERLTIEAGGDVHIKGDKDFSVGVDKDFRMTHDGTNSILRNYTGDTIIQGAATDGNSKWLYIRAKVGENSIVCKDNGTVELYYDNVKKLESTSYGVEITGGLELPDSAGGTTANRLKIGAGDDLQIFHNGTNSIISNQTGDLSIRSDNNIVFMDSGANETFAKFIDNGAVELYHDNVKTAETVSNGFQITAAENNHASLYLWADEGDDDADKWQIMATTQGQLRFYNRASGSSENTIVADGNGAVELYYDNVKKLETKAEGVIISNQGNNRILDVHHTNGDYAFISFQDQNTSGNQYVRLGAYGNILRFYGGGLFAAQIDASGHFKPGSNNTYDLGSSSLRWRNIYTQDLQLSNEAVGDNGIDGTWGNFTIVEGESDLFLKNNRSGKTYKFNLTEVS